MKSKQAHSGVRWTEKNRAFLEALGFLNKKTGGSNGSANLSKFINDCVTMCIENSIHPRVAIMGKRQVEEFKLKNELQRLCGQEAEILERKRDIARRMERNREMEFEAQTLLQNE